LESLDNEYFGVEDSWTAAAGRLRRAPFLLPEADASRVRWLDAFGELIGNDDRHFGNMTFFVEPGGKLRLAPAYDMLPMLFAPSAAGKIVDRKYAAGPPAPEAMEEWKSAAPVAVRYWRELAAARTLDAALRARAREAARELEAMASRVMPGARLDPGKRAG
jgi:hypothetical protein